MNIIAVAGFPSLGINKEPCENHGLSRNCNPVLFQ